MNKIFSNKKGGGNALGIAGIVAMIILFELLISWGLYVINNEQTKNILVSNCDCGLKGCAIYLAQNGFDALNTLCSEQAESNIVIKDRLTQDLLNQRVAVIILGILNITLIIIGILVLRGVSG